MIGIAIAAVVGGVVGFYIKAYLPQLTSEEAKIVAAFNNEVSTLTASHAAAVVKAANPSNT